jgi:flagellar hook-length control protein FliK
MREISLRLGDTASNSVDIQMVERAGHVQVAVRTPDQELTTSLQANLGELVGRLEQKGYKTETWVPAATLHPTAVLTESAGSSGHSQDQPGHSSSWDGGQHQRQEQQESGRRQQARWMTQVEQTLNGEDTGTEGIPMEDQ